MANCDVGRTSAASEEDRIKKTYENFDKAGSAASKIWTIYNPVNHYYMVQKERILIEYIKKYSLDLADMEILDVGCGMGGTLRDFIKYGASPEKLHGIDLSADRVEKAKKLSPYMDLRPANAMELPFAENSMDAVIINTVFSSVVDDACKKKIASEVSRVLKRGGVIFYYDCKERKAVTPDFKYISLRELRSLFKGFDFDLKTTIIKYEIGCRLARFSWILCQLLEKIGIFNTYYMGLLIKR